MSNSKQSWENFQRQNFSQAAFNQSNLTPLTGADFQQQFFNNANNFPPISQNPFPQLPTQPSLQKQASDRLPMQKGGAQHPQGMYMS